MDVLNLVCDGCCCVIPYNECCQNGYGTMSMGMCLVGNHLVGCCLCSGSYKTGCCSGTGNYQQGCCLLGDYLRGCCLMGRELDGVCLCGSHKQGCCILQDRSKGCLCFATIYPEVVPVVTTNPILQWAPVTAEI